MPDLQHRTEIEHAFADKLQELQAVQLQRVRAKLGNPPDEKNMSGGDWSHERDALAALLFLILSNVHRHSAEQFVGTLPFDGQPRQIDLMSVQWATFKSRELADQITEHTREIIHASIEAGKDEDLHKRWLLLAAGLGIAFGVARALRIAVTETTRAATAGEQDIADAYNEWVRTGRGPLDFEPPAPPRRDPTGQVRFPLPPPPTPAQRGEVLVPYWVTAHDEKVCPRCGPLDGQRITDTWPPLHVNCRCYARFAPATAAANAAESVGEECGQRKTE